MKNNNNNKAQYIYHFSAIRRDDIDKAGGKGANLAALTAAGFLVPPGFCLTTQAYREFIERNELEGKIAAKIASLELDVFENIRMCGAVIREFIMEAEIPEDMREAIGAAYRELLPTPNPSQEGNTPPCPPQGGNSPSPNPSHPFDTAQDRQGRGTQFSPPLVGGAGGGGYVAVRSSATAEDLPEMSFAGQHDTYLNVSGETDLLFCVKKCWSSLWSDRAIAYRHKNNIAHTTVSMAVIIQQMVASSVAGILFTANPVTNTTNELLLNAHWGLGESVVSGEVTPDEFTVDKETLLMKSRHIAEKTKLIRLGEHGAEEVAVPPEQQSQSCLSDDQIQEIAAIGKQIETYFDAPQDIEWCFAGKQLYILQSRPITTLSEPIESHIIWGNPFNQRMLEDCVIFWSNWNVRETMPYPQTPLNWSLIRDLVLPTFLDHFFGITQDSALYPSACGIDLVYGRIYWNMNLMYKAIRAFLPHVDHEAGTLFNRLYRDGTLQPPKFSAGLGTKFLGILKGILTTLKLPWFITSHKIEAIYQRYWQEALEFEQVELRKRSNQELFDEIKNFGAYTARLWLALVVVALLNVVVSLKVIQWLTRRWDDVAPDAFLAGITGNKTTEGALELYKLSQMPETLKPLFLQHEIEELPSLLEQSEPGKAFLQRLQRFLELYGHRGAKEMEISQSRWKDDLSFVFQMIRNYLQLDHQDRTPLDHFNAQKKEREDLIELVKQRLSQGGLAQRFPWKAWLFQKMVQRVSTCMPLRENEKYYGSKWYTGSRRILAELGERLRREGYLESPEDIYFLTVPELEDLFRRTGTTEQGTIQALIQQRKHEWDANLTIEPPFVLRSDGKPVVYPEEEGQAGNMLTGAPASRGKVTGKARIIFDPAEAAAFHKGEILVAPFTDPGWTPLFLTAKALVMEVGGVMCHGAVVAREYGIPAVVGVKNATKIMQTGDEITVDGEQGKVFLHES